MRARTLPGLIILALTVLSYASPLFSEEPLTEAQKRQHAVERALESISRANSGDEILKIYDDTVSELDTYDGYEHFAAGIRNLADASPAPKNKDFLDYAVAAARADQMEFLARQNDLESGRLYISSNDRYYAESLEYLGKALASTESKTLAAEAYFRKFLIYKSRFQVEFAFTAFGELVNTLTAAKDAKTLSKIADKLIERGLTNDALELKIAYAAKADKAAAWQVMEGIKASADRAFGEGDPRVANLMYERYVKDGQAYVAKEVMAPKTMEIAEKYFAARRYKEAGGYYEFYKEAFPNSNFRDYCDYKIGISLYEEKDLVKAMAKLEWFLDNYKTSVWFDKVFELLSRIYYTNYTDEKAIEALNQAIDKYYRKNTGDYARVLIGLVYYGQKNYDKALEELKKIEPSSVYSYSASIIADDIAEIRKGQTPTFTFASRDSYRVWEAHTAAMFDVVPSENGNKIEAVQEDGGVFRINVRPGAAVKFDISTAQDLDRFNEYLLDREDISRLPKKIQEATEKDILSVEWKADLGAFANVKDSKSKVWQAPREPGEYKVTLCFDDFGLVRPPDKGEKKDPTPPEAVFIVVVSQ